MAYEEVVVESDVVEVCEAELKGRGSFSIVTVRGAQKRSYRTTSCPINMRTCFHRLHYHRNNYFC